MNILVSKNGAFTAPKKFFVAVNRSGERFVVTNRKTAYVGGEYSIEETISFLKEHGHHPVSKIEAIASVKDYNSYLYEARAEHYERWKEYLQSQEKEGYSTCGVFFQDNADRERLWLTGAKKKKNT